MKRAGPPQRRTPLKRSEWGCDGACPPVRSAGLKRTRMKPKRVERDWAEAQAKVAREGRCRLCGRTGRGVKLEAAHVIGRTHDRPHPERGGSKWVNPDDVVPLCSGFDGDCHGKYDRREVSLWAVITAAEWLRAVALVGEGSARRRITGRH